MALRWLSGGVKQAGGSHHHRPAPDPCAPSAAAAAMGGEVLEKVRGHARMLIFRDEVGVSAENGTSAIIPERMLDPPKHFTLAAHHE